MLLPPDDDTKVGNRNTLALKIADKLSSIQRITQRILVRVTKAPDWKLEKLYGGFPIGLINLMSD